MAYNKSRNPLKILYDNIDSNVRVRLKNNTEWVGTLKKLDRYMNLILSNANISNSDMGLKEEIYIRGTNILFIVPELENIE